jgi:hypothetical protein
VSNAAQFPAGSYILQVEQYRTNFPQHYSYHARAVYFSR